MNIVWTKAARNELDAIYKYISRGSPAYARRMIDRLTRRSQQIAEAPYSGRRVPEYNLDQIREVIEGAYRIIYYIQPERIDVIAVVHTARNVLSEG